MAVAQRSRASHRPPAPGAGGWRWAAAVGAVVVLGLALRLWSIDHGLPFAYNQDEELHFVPVAVDFFLGSYNPGYFENPPALSYLLHVVFRLWFTEGFPFGAGGFRRAFLQDPSDALLVARVVVATIGTGVIALVFWAGARFFDRRAGLVAAGIFACAFLPVFYSKQALNDVVTLAPLTIGLVGCLLAYEGGRGRDWLLAGAALGAACATKYTAGAMAATVCVAAGLRVLERRDGVVRATAWLVGAGAAFTVAFFVLNPYALLDFTEFRSQLGGQSVQAGANAKLGQDPVPGWLHYLRTLTWGLGWAPALAALLGAALALGRRPGRGVLLVVFPVLFALFLSAQARWFGRWLLPAYPALCVLAGYAAVRVADALPMGRRGRAWVLGALGVALCAQGLVSSVRVDRVLAREDTRSLARAWLVDEVPAGTRVVVEPFVPGGWLRLRGQAGAERYDRYPIRRPFQAYEKKLRPELVDRYRREGYCWVVVGSHQKARGLKAGLAGARAYYDRLDRESALVRSWSPYREGAEPVPFSFDLSFNYLPTAYERPGPLVEVHRLEGCEPG
jgi:hypothetical protein